MCVCFDEFYRLVASWLGIKSAGMPVKSLKDSRRGIGFRTARHGDSEDSDSDPAVDGCNNGKPCQDGNAVSKEENTSRRMGPDRGRPHEKQMRRSRSASPYDCPPPQEEDYVHIGSIYDKDAMMLSSRQVHRAQDQGPWLGSFDIASMPQEGHNEGNIEIGRQTLPWWEDEIDAEYKVGDSKRRRLMKTQLEANVFKCAGVLGPGSILSQKPT